MSATPGARNRRRNAPTIYDFHGGIDAWMTASVEDGGPSVHIVASEFRDGKTATVIVDVLRRDWDALVAALAATEEHADAE